MNPPAVLTKENKPPLPLGIRVRRLVLFDLASQALGGAGKLAAALGISRRSVHHKLANDRQLFADDMTAAADAIEARAAGLMRLAAELRELAK